MYSLCQQGPTCTTLTQPNCRAHHHFNPRFGRCRAYRQFASLCWHASRCVVANAGLTGSHSGKFVSKQMTLQIQTWSILEMNYYPLTSHTSLPPQVKSSHAQPTPDCLGGIPYLPLILGGSLRLQLASMLAVVLRHFREQGTLQLMHGLHDATCTDWPESTHSRTLLGCRLDAPRGSGCWRLLDCIGAGYMYSLTGGGRYRGGMRGTRRQVQEASVAACWHVGKVSQLAEGAAVLCCMAVLAARSCWQGFVPCPSPVSLATYSSALSCRSSRNGQLKLAAAGAGGQQRGSACPRDWRQQQYLARCV